MRFAEDTLLLPPGEDGESEEGPPEAPWPLPVGRQRLIRKDTPHYKKHFKVSKLPQPEAVVALLQGTQPDGQGPMGLGGWHNGPHTAWAPRAEEEEEEEAVAEEEDEDRDEAVACAPSVKVGPPRAHLPQAARHRRLAECLGVRGRRCLGSRRPWLVPEGPGPGGCWPRPPWAGLEALSLPVGSGRLRPLPRAPVSLGTPVSPTGGGSALGMHVTL